MPDHTGMGGAIRGLGLQCPWSNCFPQLYTHSKLPCAVTPFADFREVIDHIWKYHSFLLCCEICGHRFLNGNRKEEARPKLMKLKDNHAKDCPSKKTSDHPLITMTEEQDQRLRSWKYKDGKDKDTMKPKYESLCRCLFDEEIQVPENPKYHYYLPEYTVNNSSRELGEKNLFYVQQRLSLAPITSTAGSHRQSNLDNRLPLEPLAPPDPLQLDEPSRSPPVHWELPKPVPDVDSAYGTNEASERVQASSDNPYMDPSLLFQYPVQLGWNSPNGYVSSYPGPLELEMELTDGAPGPEISDGRSG